MKLRRDVEGFEPCGLEFHDRSFGLTICWGGRPVSSNRALRPRLRLNGAQDNLNGKTVASVYRSEMSWRSEAVSASLTGLRHTMPTGSPVHVARWRHGIPRHGQAAQDSASRAVLDHAPNQSCRVGAVQATETESRGQRASEPWAQLAASAGLTVRPKLQPGPRATVRLRPGRLHHADRQLSGAAAD